MDNLHILLPLLCDPDPEVRSATAYVPAASAGEVTLLSTALRSRLAEEDDAVVRASLIPAIAQLAREHHHEHAPRWARGLWSDPGRLPEARNGVGLAWLCLVPNPVPDELRALLTGPGTRPYQSMLEQVPWLTRIDATGSSGLRRCIALALRVDVVRERCRGGTGEAFGVVQHDVVPAVRDRDHGHPGCGEPIGAWERAAGLGQQVGCGGSPGPAEAGRCTNTKRLEP